MLEALLYVLGSALFLAVFGARYLRTQRALKAPSTDDMCPACQSSDITTASAGAHRCDACGFRWGPGWKRLATAQRQAQFATMSQEERGKVAAAEIRSAEQRFLAVESEVKHGKKQLVHDVAFGLGDGIGGYGDPYSRARNEAFVKAHGEMKMAYGDLRRASEALGSLPPEELLADLEKELMWLDGFFGYAAADVVNHTQFGRLEEEAKHLRAAIDQAKRAHAALGAPSVN